MMFKISCYTSNEITASRGAEAKLISGKGHLQSCPLATDFKAFFPACAIINAHLFGNVSFENITVQQVLSIIVR